jgi:hypothetical protein
VRAFMVAKRRGKLEMGSIEAEVIRTSYWVSAVQGADVHGAGQQQREPRSARRQHEPHAIRQQPPQKALRHHTFGRGIFGSRSFFVSGSRPKWKGAVRGNVTPASDEETRKELSARRSLSLSSWSRWWRCGRGGMSAPMPGH